MTAHMAEEVSELRRTVAELEKSYVQVLLSVTRHWHNKPQPLTSSRPLAARRLIWNRSLLP
jgi:hypothetical protein